jgi:hypothetical protein
VHAHVCVCVSVFECVCVSMYVYKCVYVCECVERALLRLVFFSPQSL